MKTLSLFVITVLIISSISISVIAENNLQVRTIYVDDDNIDGPWDGTQEHPFQHIQDGVNASIDEDTVFVLNGTYYENIVIKKSICLYGEDVETTIIYGCNKNTVVVRVSVNQFTIIGFTIKNGWIGISMGYSRNNNTISGNNIIDNLFGISLSDSLGNTIWRNTISNNTLEDISLSDSSANKIIDNTIINNEFGTFGITLQGSSNNIITGNTINNHSESIFLEYSLGNTISGNTITNNSNNGIYLYGSYNNKINNNNFIENNIHAIFYNSYLNSWLGNYWDDWISSFPKPIIGAASYIIPIPIINFDWHPASEPFGIEGE
jgi:parallel beta-helix repeat protein